eukprot:CAMPEP_0119061880 /NCGR_PEP_ID=MMETSP1178-20130426/5601_1 /TAXON_ID=33656 /ORGANISM="unid sp, Strain CCMP2000" /LENGTH=56 /DNA_ID=CAMNT_0007043117 /DNA_START=122 /DNA_END=292 /DNA_ORIENTATION=+
MKIVRAAFDDAELVDYAGLHRSDFDNDRPVRRDPPDFLQPWHVYRMPGARRTLSSC